MISSAPPSDGVKLMNDHPHLLAIVESKMAQVRTNLEHNNFSKADLLLDEVKIYAEALQQPGNTASIN